MTMPMRPTRAHTRGSRGPMPVLVPMVLSLLLAGLLFSSAAVAVPMAPGWTIRSVAEPTGFSSGQGRYVLLVSNVGGGPSEGPVSISDTLPPGVTPTGVSGEDLGTIRSLHCTRNPVECTNELQVAPGDTLLVTIEVTVANGVKSIVNSASVSGGGAPSEATTEATTVGGAPAPFGIEDFDLQLFDAGGAQDALAGSRPYTLATSFHLTTVSPENTVYIPVEEAKDIVVDLPPGVAGDPLAAAKCPLNVLVSLSGGVTSCPAGSRIGTVVFEGTGGGIGESQAPGNNISAIYNLVPEAGYPAEFGFTRFGVPIVLYASLAHTDAGFVLRTTVPGAVEYQIAGSSLVLFGDPTRRDSGESGGLPFFTNPVDCSAGPLSARMRMNSWEEPGHWVEATSTVYPKISECNVLQFQPNLHVRPETSQADEHSGYEIEVEVPQNESALTPGTPELRDATVTLPAGVSVSPSAADGLAGCPAEGREGINVGREWNAEGVSPPDPEATKTGADGLPHIAPGHCPHGSQIGTVEVSTPVLPQPLEGHLYLAQPRCGGNGQPLCTPADATNGNLFGVYLEAAGAGVVLKLAGQVSVNPATGQLTTSFTENPELPFSDLKVRLKGGPRAPLANPQACGLMTASSDMTPWSSPVTPDATPLAQFGVDWSGAGEPCPAGLPFAPGFLAQTQTPAAGAYSPFTMTLTRTDRQQDISQVQIHLPPGLLGTLANVPLCGEAQAAAGTCPAASEVGTTTVAAGAGSHPYWVTGRVYLTGPYGGAPFGLSIVVPAQAGPFNLGNVVVRARIDVDRNTAVITVTSDSLPQIIDGVPLRIQTVNVTVNRPEFIFNPTDCTQRSITGTVAGAQGAVAAVSAPFAAGGCATLPFKPKFTVSTSNNASKAKGVGLDVKVASGAGQANIAKVAVSLPKQLPSRLTTLQQACPEATFAANPAACPAGSLVGVARASSPVLPVTLTGPAYLVSHGGAAFPDLVVILQGEGVRVDLTGNTSIKKGITSSTFASVPDAPIRTFELKLPQGPHSALAANGSLCAKPLLMPTTIGGQNGAQVKQSTRIAVSGCPKAAKKRRTAKKRRK
jgi:hypothetical protein